MSADNPQPSFLCEMKQLEEKLVCPVCGAEKKMLGAHMLRVHGMTAEETKQKFGLESLTAPATLFRMTGENNHFHGKHHTDESKDQMIMNRDDKHYTKWTPPLCKAGCGRRVKTRGFEYCHECAMRIKNSGENNSSKRPDVRKKLVENHASRGPNAAERNGKIAKSKTGVPRPDMQGDKNPAKRPEVRKKIAIAVGPTSKQHWQDPEFVRKQVKARSKPKNKLETRVEQILDWLCSREYKFVGDGKFFIETKNPDFININGQKKVVEVYGDYWHEPEEEQERIKLFAQYGFQTLVIWEHELKDMDKLEKKILRFHARKRFNDCNQNISNEMMGQSGLHSDMKRSTEMIDPVSEKI